MRPKIFIDGHGGSTGLRIHELLGQRNDLEVITLDDDQRKVASARQAAIQEADFAVLCLPDDAAREAVQWACECDTRVIDASSAHRVADGWVYGIPELAGHRESIRSAKLVANPGCYPTSVILLLRPLIDAGILARSAPIAVHALSGYSGGGRKLIERWEAVDGGLVHLPHESPYALDRIHKHIPEMTKYSGLTAAPAFAPAVGPFRCGMRVQVPLHASLLEDATAETIWKTIDAAYPDEAFVQVATLDEPSERNERSFDPQLHNSTNVVELFVLPNPAGHVMLMGILDNLGKGASGAAVQNLNIMLGCDEATGLVK